MDSIIRSAVLFSLYQVSVALMPPTVGECKENFIDIYPPKLMETWYVVKHTDSLLFPGPLVDCLIMKFGRRMSFNSQIRLDVIYSNSKDPDESKDSKPPMRGEVTVTAKEPFGLNIPLSILFPVNIMVTTLDDTSECMAFWSCADIAPKLIQKGAWIMCKSTDVDEKVVDNLLQKVASSSGIDSGNFITTNYDSCL